MSLDLARKVQRDVYIGNYERAQTRLVCSFLKPEMTVLDIGANVGYYTALAALDGGGGWPSIRGRGSGVPLSDNLNYAQALSDVLIPPVKTVSTLPTCNTAAKGWQVQISDCNANRTT